MDSTERTKRDERVLLATWFVLVSLTVASFWLSDGQSASSARAVVWLLGIATLKSHLIAVIFMEMRTAPVAWAVVMSGFLVAEAALVVAILP